MIDSGVLGFCIGTIIGATIIIYVTSWLDTRKENRQRCHRDGRSKDR